MIASLSAKTVYSSTNLGSGKINCKMLPFELLYSGYLLDFFAKPLKKISDTCYKGRDVEFLDLRTFLILKYLIIM